MYDLYDDPRKGKRKMQSPWLCGEQIFRYLDTYLLGRYLLIHDKQKIRARVTVTFNLNWEVGNVSSWGYRCGYPLILQNIPQIPKGYEIMGRPAPFTIATSYMVGREDPEEQTTEQYSQS